MHLVSAATLVVVFDLSFVFNYFWIDDGNWMRNNNTNVDNVNITGNLSVGNGDTIALDMYSNSTDFIFNFADSNVLMNYTVPEVDTVSVVDDYQPLEGVIEEYKLGEIIKAENIPDDLPQIFRGGLIEKDKTKSLVIVPLSIGNQVIGNLAFSCYEP